MRTLVVGIGDTAFHDLGVGPEVVRRLRQYDLTDVALAVVDGGADLRAEDVRGVDRLVVVCATVMGHRPGWIHTLVLEPPRSASLPAGAPLEPLLRLCALAGVPQRLIIFTVEAADVTPGIGITDSVAPTLDRLAYLVARELGTHRHARAERRSQ